MTPQSWTTENTPRRLAVILAKLCGGNASKLSRKIGVHHVTLSRWVHGHRAPQRLVWPALDALEAEAVKIHHLEQRREEKTP